MLTDAEVLHEACVYMTPGTRYYVHESGTVFASLSTDIRRLRPRIERVSLPSHARPVRVRSEAAWHDLDEWTDTCDELARRGTSCL